MNFEFDEFISIGLNELVNTSVFCNAIVLRPMNQFSLIFANKIMLVVPVLIMTQSNKTCKSLSRFPILYVFRVGNINRRINIVRLGPEVGRLWYFFVTLQT